MIETRLLKQFIAVAEELHFHRAAARLNMAQPPLSQAIARLEDRLGFQLLVRSKREVTLTQAGQAFLETAYATLNLLEDGIMQARRVAMGVTGRLTVSTISLAYYAPVLETLRAFRTTLPGVELVIQEMPSSHQLDGLLSGDVDIALMRDLPLPPLIESQTVLNEEIMLALPTGHPRASNLSADDTVNLGDFADADFVFTPRALGPGYYHQLMALCQAAGFYPTIRQEAAQLHTLLGLVASGLGIALVPSSLSRSVLLDKVVFCPLAPAQGTPAKTLTLNVNWHSGNTSPLISKFTTLLCQQA